MKRIRAFAAAVVLAAAATGLMISSAPAAAAAPAAAVAHASHLAPGTSAIPLTQCPIVPHRFTTYRKGCVAIKGHLCTPGNQGNLTPPPLYVSNGCSYRGYLYPGKGEQGTGLCISPHSASKGLQRFYLSFRITLNKSPC